MLFATLLAGLQPDRASLLQFQRPIAKAEARGGGAFIEAKGMALITVTIPMLEASSSIGATAR